MPGFSLFSIWIDLKPASFSPNAKLTFFLQPLQSSPVILATYVASSATTGASARRVNVDIVMIFFSVVISNYLVVWW